MQYIGDLEPDHDDTIPHKCGAEAHYCNRKCEVPKCDNECKLPYDAEEGHRHVCNQTQCPYRCQVQIWDMESKRKVQCREYCSRVKNENEIHLCGQEHDIYIYIYICIYLCITRYCVDLFVIILYILACPEPCKEGGWCYVIFEQNFEEKIYKSRGGSTIKYDSYTEPKGFKKPCAFRIPAGKFKHDGNDHKCYHEEKEQKDNQKIRHTCTETCDSWYEFNLFRIDNMCRNIHDMNNI